MHALERPGSPHAGSAGVLVWLAVGILTCCSGGVGTEVSADAGFVRLADAVSEVLPEGSAAGAGLCSVLEPTACTGATPRCVPSAAEGTVCAASGSLGEGAPCAVPSSDPCGYGLLCTGSDAVSLRCRRVCRPESGCTDGSVCGDATYMGGEWVGFCAGEAS